MTARSLRISSSLTACLLASVVASTAFGQNGRPLPAEPIFVPAVEETTAPTDPTQPASGNGNDTAPANGTEGANGEGRAPDSTGTRRPSDAGEVLLAFKEASVEDLIDFIATTTGKVVMPIRPQTLRTQKITLMSDKAVERTEALDLLFAAFRLNDIGIIERDDRIIVGAIADIVSTLNMDVLGPDDDVRYRQDVGNFVMKIYRLDEADAEAIGEQLVENMPDYASLTVDANSNQIVVIGDIALCQHLQEVIDQLDNTYIKVKTETFRLRYADASEIAGNIEELFEQTATTASRTSQARRTPTARGRTAQAAANQATGQPGPTAELRLTVNTQMNSVTVQADPSVITNIGRLISEYWDLPRPEGTSKMYTLQFTDPIKVRDMLQELLESGGGGGGAAARRTGGGAAGGGGRSAVQEIVGGIFRLEAYPDTNSLLVLCKTEENFDYLDSIVESIDQPSTVGLPIIIELKHASAVSLADELNVLLSVAGSNITLSRPDAGLSGQGLDTGESGGGAAGGATGRETEEGGDIRFPWQTGGRQSEDQSPETPLIGKTRIVPIVRQNALAILAPPQYQESVREMIQYLDRPGRQVMISAIIAEVELNDDLALGLRVSASSIPLTNIDASVAGSVNGNNVDNPTLGNVFDVGVLDFNFSANWVLQALAQKTNVRILQEPRVFTADNQEAVFFDGQDVPFVTDSFSNNTGGLTQGFEYRQVGVVLNARPRITAQRDVEMEIYLELSSIVSGQTLFGGAIVDRRSTTSQVVVKDGQTIVLSGILRDAESKIKRKVPLLGDIPLLGALFTSIENAQVTTELVAFVTPIVVDNPTDNDNNYNKEEVDRLNRLREIDVNEAHEDIRDALRDRILTPQTAEPYQGPEGASSAAGDQYIDPEEATLIRNPDSN